MPSERNKNPKNQPLTIYLPDGAASGRVLRFRETGLEACVDAPVPRDARFRFVLHLRESVISGEVESLGQEAALCRLRYAALTERDRARLAPLVEED